MNEWIMRQKASQQPIQVSRAVEFVVAAHEAGYFEVPRKISLVALAEREGVDGGEASRLLRYGLQDALATADLEASGE